MASAPRPETPATHGLPSTGRASRPSSLFAGDRRFGLLLALPATIVVVLLIGGPAIQTFIYSLQKVSFNGPSTWVGFDNYARVFASPNFQHSLGVTVKYAIGFLVLSTGLGLGFALLLNEPLRLRWACHRALAAAADPRADGVLQHAHAELLAMAAGIDEPAARQAFLSQSEAHRGLAAAWAVRAAGA